LAGVVLSAVALEVHRRLGEGSGYTSFCNLGGIVNCDTVLGSRYSVVLGAPVPAWGIAGFAAGAALALPGALAASAGGLADLLLLGLVSASLGFALVLAGAMMVLGSFFFSSRRRHTIFKCDWSSDVCSSDLTRSGQSGSLS